VTNWGEGCLKCLGCCCADFENVYNVYVAGDKKPLLIAEEDSSCLNRCLCNPNHALKLTFKAPAYGNDVVMEMRKPFKCCCPAWISCFQKEVDIWQTKPQEKFLGKVRQPWCGGFFRPKLMVWGDEEMEKPAGHVGGPLCFIGTCCPSEWDFFDEKGDKHVRMDRGGLGKTGLAGLTTNKDIYDVTVLSKSATTEEKLVMLSTVIFIDYLFFEGETACHFDWFDFSKFPMCLICPPSLYCKFCDWYVCGATIPCKVKCCYQEALGAAAGVP